MSSAIKIQIGQTSGRLTVIESGSDVSGHLMWVCKCECGKTLQVRGSAIARNHIKSCGCLKLDRSAERFTTHGKTYTAVYGKWRAMKRRCSPDHIHHEDYYDRGIRVCEPGMELDRINNDGNYEPSNCRWVTREANQANRRCSLNIPINGVLRPAKDVAKELGLHYQTMVYRMRQGWSVEKLLGKQFAHHSNRDGRAS